MARRAGDSHWNRQEKDMSRRSILLLLTGAAGLTAAPHAWGDKDGDGKCDRTGKPVGQGQGNGKMGGCCGRGGRGGARQCQRQPADPPQEKK
jgi:hypothetical protein